MPSAGSDGVAKKKGGGQKSVNVEELVKGLLPSEPKKNFTLLSKDGGDKGSGSMVATYAKAMSEHIVRHYELFGMTMMTPGMAAGSSPINPMDFLHYHTYGDYRMVLENEKIRFVYRALNRESIGRQDISLDPRMLNRAEVDHVIGLYSPRRGDKGITLESDNIPWMTEELNKGSSGTRLMLPSIGTLAIMTYGYRNINVEFKKLVTNLLEKINSLALEEDSEFDLPDYLRNALLSNNDFLQLTQDHRNKVIETFVKAKDEEKPIAYITRELIESTTTRYVTGEAVYIKESISTSERGPVEDYINEVLGEDFGYAEELFTIEGVIPGKQPRYRLKLPDSDATVTVSQQHLKPSGPPSRFIEKKKKSFVAIPRAEVLVTYRILMDIIFGTHSYFLLAKKEKILNFAYVSPSLVPKNDKQLKKLVPNMKGPTEDAGTIKKKKQPFIDQLAAFRLLYTQMIMKAQRAAAIDKTVFDEFYKGSLLEREVRWLSYALSEDAKVLIEKPEIDDPLSQLVYRGGTQEGVTLVGEADRRTTFYQIEIPMFKEVVTEYIRAFNQITIDAAFSVDSGDLKEGVVAKALWGSIRKRSAMVLDQEGIIPHQFFADLFNSVNREIQGTMLTFDPYPPSWSDTGVLTKLTLDPNELGMLVTIDEYKKHLKEYMDYIFLRFGNRAGIAGAILSAVEEFRVRASTDYQQLRKEFAAMLIEQDKKKQMKGTGFNFRAYNLVIAIMRAELATPLSLRGEMIARGMEEELARQISAREYGDRGIIAVPRGHSRFDALNERAEQRLAPRPEAVVVEEAPRDIPLPGDPTEEE